jgi:hypothetical protein
MGKVCSCNREEEKDKAEETNLVIIFVTCSNKQNKIRW